MDSKKNILLVDDDIELCGLLRDFLSQHQLNIETAHSGEEAIKLIKEDSIEHNHNFDLLILDIMLPGISGLTALKEIRINNSIPIVMLTASGEEKDRILGLELGADDYLPKPFSSLELLARIKAILRRSSQLIKQNDMSFGLIEISINARTAKYNNLALKLTGTEFEILSCLTLHQGNTVNKDELSEAKKLDEILQPVHSAMFVESNPSPVKYGAKLMNLCDDEVRLPLVKVTDNAKVIVKKALEFAKLI